MANKLKCWKKVKSGIGELYLKKGEALTITKVNFSFENPAHNVVTFDRSKPNLESSLGKVKHVEFLGTKAQAIKFAKSYMDRNDKC